MSSSFTVAVGCALGCGFALFAIGGGAMIFALDLTGGSLVTSGSAVDA